MVQNVRNVQKNNEHFSVQIIM